MLAHLECLASGGSGIYTEFQSTISKPSAIKGISAALSPIMMDLSHPYVLCSPCRYEMRVDQKGGNKWGGACCCCDG